MSKRKREQLKKRKQSKGVRSQFLKEEVIINTIELEFPKLDIHKMQAPILSQREIRDAIQHQQLLRNFSFDVMTHSIAELRARKSRSRLRLPDMADLSSPGKEHVETTK